MKATVNTFAVSGFVGNTEIRQFSTASVNRFSLAVGRTENVGDEQVRTSAFLNVEAWRKNEKADSFEVIKKGQLITVEGYFKPEEWTDPQTGVKKNRVVLVATSFFATPDKETKPTK